MSTKVYNCKKSEVWRGRTRNNIVAESRNVIPNPLINKKPMQIRQNRRNVVKFGCSEDEMGCTVYYFF